MKEGSGVAQIDVYNRERGVTYVYESFSYWDKDLKQPRSKRKLIGKRDADGNIVPTGGRGRKKTFVESADSSHSDTKYKRKYEECLQLVQEKDNIILTLKQQLAEMQRENYSLHHTISQCSTLLEKVMPGKGAGFGG